MTPKQHLYFDAIGQLVLFAFLLVSVLTEASSLWQNLLSNLFAFAFYTSVWQFLNALASVYHYENPLRKLYIRYFGIMFVVVSAIMAVLFFVSATELQYFGTFASSYLWYYAFHFLWNFPLSLFAFILYYSYLTIWDIQNKYKNTI